MVTEYTRPVTKIRGSGVPAEWATLIEHEGPCLCLGPIWVSYLDAWNF